MKQSILNKILIAVAAFAVAACPALAYDENVDHISTGANAVNGIGAAAMNKAVVLQGTYDFSTETYDTNDIIKLVSVPAGVLIDKVVVSVRDTDQIVTNTLYKYTSEWAAEDSAIAYAADTDASTVYYFLSPTYANTNASNVEVVITDDTIAATQTATSWGFINTLTTNGAPTEGTITISVIGYDLEAGDR